MVERLVCLSWFPKRAECFLPCFYWSTFIFYLYKLLHMKREKIKNIAMLAMLLVWLDLLGCEWTRSCERGRDEVDYVNVRSASNEGLWRIRKMHISVNIIIIKCIINLKSTPHSNFSQFTQHSSHNTFVLVALDAFTTGFSGALSFVLDKKSVLKEPRSLISAKRSLQGKAGKLPSST